MNKNQHVSNGFRVKQMNPVEIADPELYMIIGIISSVFAM